MTENNNDNKHNAADDLKDAKVEVTVESKGKENDLSVKDNGGAEESGDMPKETGDKEKQEPPTPDEIIADLRIKLEESEDKHLRLAAEFDNFRKRTARQYEDMIRVANQNIISQILEVVDNFERALEAADKSSDHDSLYKGMKLVYKNLYDILTREGLEPIEAVGREFDPNLHEAMMQIDSDEYPEGTVVQEITRGYKLAGKVVRHSRVSVSKGPAGDDDKKGGKERE